MSPSPKGRGSAGGPIPFYPPRGNLTIDDYLRSAIGGRAYVLGNAVGTAAGPAVSVNTMPRAEVAILYVRDIASWPRHALHRTIAIVGTIGRELIRPEERDAAAGRDERFDFPQWTLTEAAWSVPQILAAVAFIPPPLRSTERLQGNLTRHLRGRGYSEQEFYVTHVETVEGSKPRMALLSIAHVDSFDPSKEGRSGGGGPADQTIHYNLDDDAIVGVT